ncbi:MAG: WD40 repeat domain-containing protein [Kineosporiaceae bacterium]
MRRRLSKSRIVVVIVAALGLVATATWFGRAESWPCGRLDRGGTCVSSTRLDVAALGLDPGTTRVDFRSFDLGPGARTALVGVTGRSGERYRTVLALFDARTGAPIRVLRDLAGGPVSEGNGSSSAVDGAAFSPDGTRVVSWAWGTGTGGAIENDLRIQDTANADVVTTLHQGSPLGVRPCAATVGLSPDNTQVQCADTVTDLASGTTRSLWDGSRRLTPRYAGFSGGYLAIAADGTLVEGGALERPDGGARTPLTPRVTIADEGISNYGFSPDGRYLFDAHAAYSANRGTRRITPAPFRTLSVIGIWNVRTARLERTLTLNDRYHQIAWSRDGSRFGIVTRDLDVQVFTR